jgi:hypothetical protein
MNKDFVFNIRLNSRYFEQFKEKTGIYEATGAINYLISHTLQDFNKGCYLDLSKYYVDEKCDLKTAGKISFETFNKYKTICRLLGFKISEATRRIMLKYLDDKGG